MKVQWCNTSAPPLAKPRYISHRYSAHFHPGDAVANVGRTRIRPDVISAPVRFRDFSLIISKAVRRAAAGGRTNVWLMDRLVLTRRQINRREANDYLSVTTSGSHQEMLVYNSFLSSDTSHANQQYSACVGCSTCLSVCLSVGILYANQRTHGTVICS